MEIRNSLWVVDKAGKLALVDSISGSDAVVRYSDKKGKFGDLVRVPVADLKQAKVADLHENHGMAPAELEALGYAGEAKAEHAPAPEAKAPEVKPAAPKKPSK